MILVTGGTGSVGRPLVNLLAGQGVWIRVLTRDPDGARMPPETEWPGPVASSSPYAEAIQGVTAVLANPRGIGTSYPDLLATAAATGVARVVALSTANVEDQFERQLSRHRGDPNAEVEAAVTESGLDWVILRPSVYAGNTLGLWGGQLPGGDVVYGPYADAADAPIDEADIAAVAAVALCGAGHDGSELARPADPTAIPLPQSAGGVSASTRLVLTGPQSLNQRQMLVILGTAVGRHLHYCEVEPSRARDALIGQGSSDGFADAYLRMQSAAAGRRAEVTSTAAEVLGRAPTPFGDWARRYADRQRSAA